MHISFKNINRLPDLDKSKYSKIRQYTASSTVIRAQDP